jgi:hypothetical protein
MKNMPSVMKEMPNGAPRPVSGKKMQKGLHPASVNGLDVISSSVVPISPVAFHRLLQDSLRIHDPAGIGLASLTVDGQDQGSAAGKAQLPTPGGEKGLLPLAGPKSRSGKGRLVSVPGDKGKTGKKISVEESLSANPNVAISSQNILMVDKNLCPPQETTESLVQLQNASGKTHDHHRSDFRHTGEYSVVRGEQGGARRNAAVLDKGKLGNNVPIVETDGNAKMGPGGDVDAAAHRIRSVEAMYDQENRGAADDASLLSPLGEGSDKRVRTARGVQTSSLVNASAIAAGNAVPLSSGSENGSRVFSAGRQQHASVKIDDHIRSGHRYTGGHSAFPKEKGGSIGSAAIGETDGNAETGFPDDAGDVTRSIHSVETRSDKENTRRADGSPLPAMLGEGSGKRTQAAPGEKASSLSTAAAVPIADAALIAVGSDDEKGILSAGLLHNVSEKMHNHLRSSRRQTGEYSAVSGEKSEPGKNATILEMEGNATAIHADAVDDVTRGVHGAEPRHTEENKGRADGSPLLTLFKENSGEHFRRAVVGEKTALFSPASGVPVVDVASISGGGFDSGEGILSPGRQALLMAEVIDTARPLVQQGGGRVRISLSPPSLGALEIDVRVRKDGVELFVVANNADVQQTLCSHIDQLRKALVEQGLNMDRFQVVVGDRSDGQQGRDPRQEGMSGGHREAWSEKGYLPGLGGDTAHDEMGNSALAASYPSVGGINLFI